MRTCLCNLSTEIPETPGEVRKLAETSVYEQNGVEIQCDKKVNMKIRYASIAELFALVKSLICLTPQQETRQFARFVCVK